MAITNTGQPSAEGGPVVTIAKDADCNLFQRRFIMEPIARPMVTKPTDGEIVKGKVYTFEWTAGDVGVINWRLVVGKKLDGRTICDGPERPDTKQEVNTLPADNTRCYVKVEYQTTRGGDWYPSNSVKFVSAPATATTEQR